MCSIVIFFSQTRAIAVDDSNTASRPTNVLRAWMTATAEVIQGPTAPWTANANYPQSNPQNAPSIFADLLYGHLTTLNIFILLFIVVAFNF